MDLRPQIDALSETDTEEDGDARTSQSQSLLTVDAYDAGENVSTLPGQTDAPADHLQPQEVVTEPMRSTLPGQT